MNDQPALFDTGEPSTTPAEQPWNVEQVRDCNMYGIPQYCLIVSEVEAQALADGVVATRVVRMCNILPNDHPALSVSE